MAVYGTILLHIGEAKEKLMNKTRLLGVLSLVLLTAMLAGCGGGVVNKDLECEGDYALVSVDDQPLNDLLEGWSIRLVKHDAGYYLVEWLEDIDGKLQPITDASGMVWQDAGIAFGDDLLAIGSIDGPMVMVLRVGEGNMSGCYAAYGEDEVHQLHAVGDGGDAFPEFPKLEELDKDGVFDVRGDNPPPQEDTYYEGIFRLEKHGKVVYNQQDITTGYIEQDPFAGVGLVAEGTLVLVTGPYLAVYGGGDGDWEGMWVEAGNEALAAEELHLQ